MVEHDEKKMRNSGSSGPMKVIFFASLCTRMVIDVHILLFRNFVSLVNRNSIERTRKFESESL